MQDSHILTIGIVRMRNKINPLIRTSLSQRLPAARAKNSQRTICVLLRQKKGGVVFWPRRRHRWT